MTLHLTALRNTLEAQAAKAFLEFQGIKYVMHLSTYYASNNGGKGSLITLRTDGTPIGGFFDLVDWVRNNRNALL